MYITKRFEGLYIQLILNIKLIVYNKFSLSDEKTNSVQVNNYVSVFIKFLLFDNNV